MNIFCFILATAGIFGSLRLYRHSSVLKERARTTSRLWKKEEFEIRSQNYSVGALLAIILSILIAVAGLFLTMMGRN